MFTCNRSARSVSGSRSQTPLRHRLTSETTLPLSRVFTATPCARNHHNLPLLQLSFSIFTLAQSKKVTPPSWVSCVIYRLKAAPYLTRRSTSSTRLLQSPRSRRQSQSTTDPRCLQESRAKTPPGPCPQRLARTRSTHQALPSHQRRLLHVV
jgi:hypothetical protein